MPIDELVRGTAWASRPHADHVYLCGGKIVVVEETGRPEYRDLKKVRESMEMLRRHPVLGSGDVAAGIVHYERSDTMFNKMVVREARRKPPILPANCRERLCQLLQAITGYSC